MPLLIKMSFYLSSQGPQTAITVVESPAQDIEGTTGGLETFLRNMAAERIQCHLYDVIFLRDVETCKRERVQAYKIKYADNTDLINAVFGVRCFDRNAFFFLVLVVLRLSPSRCLHLPHHCSISTPPPPPASASPVPNSP